MNSQSNAGQTKEPHFIMRFDDSGRNGKSFVPDLLNKVLSPTPIAQGPEYSAKEKV